MWAPTRYGDPIASARETSRGTSALAVPLACTLPYACALPLALPFPLPLPLPFAFPFPLPFPPAVVVPSAFPFRGGRAGGDGPSPFAGAVGWELSRAGAVRPCSWPGPTGRGTPAS